MTNRQAAIIASRALCAWFIYSAVLDLGALPAMVTALEETSSLSDALNSPTFTHHIGGIILVPALASLFRLIINVAAAVIFYRCGPRAIRFLTAATDESESVENSPTA